MAQPGSEKERIAKDKGKGGPCRFRRAPRIVLRKSPTLLQLSYLSKLSTHRDASSAQNVVFPVPGVPVTRMFAAEDISTDETLELSRSVVLLNIISIYFISTSLDRAPLARVLKKDGAGAATAACKRQLRRHWCIRSTIAGYNWLE